MHRPDHWILAGTGLKQGDLLGTRDKIVTYECDGCDLEWRDGLPVPTCRDGTPETFEILATAPAGLTSFGSIPGDDDGLYVYQMDWIRAEDGWSLTPSEGEYAGLWLFGFNDK